MNFAPTLVVSACLLLASCNSDARSYLAAGNKYFDSGRFEDAIIQYRKSLQKDPRNGELYYRLGLAELRLGDGTQALSALVEAASLLPRREDINGKLADVLLVSYLKSPETGKQVYQKLIEISSQLLAKYPNSYNGWRIKGYIAFLDKHPEEAASALAKANAARPYDPELVASLSQALFQTNRSAEGEKLALELLERKKDAAAVYDILYRFYMGTGRTQDAEALAKTKCANNPKDPHYVIDLAFHYLRSGQPQQVSATLNSLLSRGAEFPQARLYIGDFYAQARDWDQAIRTYKDGARSAPKDKEIYSKRTVAILLQLGRVDEAKTLIDSILHDAPNDHEAQLFHARLLLQNGQPAALDQSIQEFKKILDKTPRDETVHLDLGRAYYLESKLDEAWTQFQIAARLRSDYVPALLGLAEISQVKDTPEETLRFASDVLWFAPHDREARLLRCLGLIGTGYSDEADLALRALLKDFPEDRNARLQLGLLDIWEKKYDEAEALFRSVHQPGSADTAGLEGIVETYAAQGRLAKAVTMLQGEAQLPGAAREVHLLLAHTAVRGGFYPIAIAEYLRMVAADPHRIDLQVRLGEAYTGAGDYQNAVSVLRKANESAPSDPAPLRALALTLITADRKTEAVTACRQLLAVVPDDLNGLNNLAFLLAETNTNSVEAVALAQRARSKAPDNETVADTLGWAFLKEGATESALQVFTMLVKKYPDRSPYHYHFGAALMQKGRRDEARTELEAALDKHPSKADEAKIKGLLAQLLAGSEKRPGA
jgi:tetratricopeptide (TPR) repeat protein